MIPPPPTTTATATTMMTPQLHSPKHHHHHHHCHHRSESPSSVIIDGLSTSVGATALSSLSSSTTKTLELHATASSLLFLPLELPQKKSKKRVRFQNSDRHEEKNVPCCDATTTTSIIASDNSTTTTTTTVTSSDTGAACSSSSSSCYWSREEIHDFHRQGQKDALKLAKLNIEYARDLSATFQECCSSSSSSEKQQQQISQSKVQRLLEYPGCGELRGLESQVLKSLRKHRQYHVKSLLLIQDRCRGQDIRNREHILKVRSQQTSRPCRSLARLFAIIDNAQVAAMVRQELYASP